MIRTDLLTYTVEDLAFQFQPINLNTGENLLVVGPSGSGKSTYLHLLAGLIRPHSGVIEIQGIRLSELSQAKSDEFRKTEVGMVFQKPKFIESLSVLENLKIISADTKNIEAILSKINLASSKNKSPKNLSGGEQQRLALALALVKRPRLILADEPTANLDDENCNRVMEFLLESAESNQANLIVVTHDNRVKPYFENQMQFTK